MILTPPQWIKRHSRDELRLARWRLDQIRVEVDRGVDYVTPAPSFTAIRDLMALTDEQVVERMRDE